MACGLIKILDEQLDVKDSGSNVGIYLEKLFKFLMEYSWIYDMKNTDLFINNTLEHIPNEWRSTLSRLNHEALQQLPFPESSPVKESLPPSLIQFLNTAAELSLPRRLDESIQPVCMPAVVKRGMTPKKCHEVSHMAAVIEKACKESKCTLVLDVGSGLGYLGNVLSEQCGLHVLGLESIDERSHGATKLTEKNCFSTALVDSVPFRLTDSERCFDEIETILTKKLDTIVQKSDQREDHRHVQSVCMVGLHCCGSLTPIMLKLLQRPIIGALVCVGCCYHAIPVHEDGMHEHFPMSNCVKHFMTAAKKDHPSWRLGTFGLRLAAQETRARWYSQTPDDHLYHTKNVAYRGILEAWAKTAGVQLKKEARLIAKKKDFTDFQSYIDAVISRTSLKDHPTATEEILKVHEQYQDYFALIEPFTALQVVMQPVIETFVVVDRVLYLNESDLSAKVIRIFDENLSPRNLALLVHK